AHSIAPMAFNGTTNVPEGEMVPLLARYGLAFGPDTNAFTSREVVGYQLSLPTTEEQVVDTGLFLMRGTAAEMVFDPESLERERGIILGEERYRNTPIRRFF
ncbi:insulinase family protein, partial [Marinicauda algicola]